VAENIFLGREPRRFGLIDRRRMHQEAWGLLTRLGVHVDVSRPLGAINVALQQMVAIARAISFESKLVVMDEPTSSLDEAEVATLFDVTRLELVALMLGKDLAEVRRSGATGFADTTHHAEQRLLEARGLRGAGRTLRHADVRVRAGEIVGLAGLLGSGRTELARAIFGADPLEAGELKVDGRPVRFGSPADAIKAGIGLAPEDRKTEGIVPEMSLRENLTLALLPAISRYGIVDRRRQDEVVDRFLKRLDIKTTGPDQKIRELSGGNQQKVLLARWLCLDPRLLLLDEPTRGIDVGAKGEIQALINELADNGLGVLMISSELEEIIEGSDRVVVLRDGRTVAELPYEAISEDAIMQAMAEGRAEDGERERGDG
jgi:monosaccharide-transporting ATPase